MRNLGWLVPAKIIEDKERCINQLRRSLSYLVDAGHQTASSCDKVLRQYQDFVGTPSTLEVLSEFDPSSSRLDVLFHDQLSSQRSLSTLWAVIQKLMLLSHGQASIERGFSVNREVVTENLSGQTLIALRSISDHVLSTGGRPEEVVITPELLTSAASARSRHQAYLDEERRRNAGAKRGEKRKAAEDELQELKRKRTQIKASIESMLSSADSFAEQAEEAGKITLLAKSNALRRAAKEKTDCLRGVESNIAGKEEELKKLRG